MDLCEHGHDRCYANVVLTINPPRYPWICRRCGERGQDVGVESRLTNEYDDLLKRFPTRAPKE